MSQGYRLQISSPKTSTGAAKVWEFTPATGNVITIETSLKKDKHRISNLVAKLYDPGWAIFNALPDIAFWDVPVTLYLSQPGNANSVTQLVFEGKATELSAGYPGPDTMTIVAHDRSIDMRRRKLYRTFRNLTSVQIAKKIATTYGFDVEVDLGSVQLRPVVSDIGAELTDWDHMARALAADGLELYHKGRSKIAIRQAASLAYPITFQKLGPLNIKLEPKINHVGTGAGGDKRGPVALATAGTFKAITDPSLTQAATDEKADKRSHRTPAVGAATETGGAHSEDVATRAWTNQVTQLKRRKDTATLTCDALPDIGLHHTANLAGWGGKVDGTWFLEEIKHTITGTEYPMSTLEMKRGPSSAAIKSAGIPLQTGKTVDVITNTK